MGNLAIRGQLGLARNIDSPFPPFVIDNNRNVRGAGNLVQRGNTYWAINTEYRHSLFEKGWFALQGNVFVDMAGIRPVDSKLSQLFKSENNYQYGGIGLRIIHKYIYKAVLRIDYGINLDGFKKFIFGLLNRPILLTRVSILYSQSLNPLYPLRHREFRCCKNCLLLPQRCG